jgi:hypothetical protein
MNIVETTIMKTAIATALLAASMAAGFGAPALAGEKPKEDAKELAGYVRTGKTESCLRAHNIDSARILNSHQILFKMRGGADYLNEPSCRLSKSYALKYDVTVGQLCDTTIVTLLDVGSSVPERGSCSLSPFIELEKKTASVE